LNPARRGALFLKAEALGAAGQLSRRVAERLKFRQDAFLAEINLGPFYCSYYGVQNSRRYQPIPRFPAVERDFSLVLSDGTHFADVVKVISSLNIPEIASVEAADLFRGKNIPPAKYSLLVKVMLQPRSATLTDAQIGEISARIVSALEKELGAQLRTA
jgi:phenylalanyl-tRNA synthetase beta chain